MDTDEEEIIKEKYNDVLEELVLLHEYKYKELIKYLQFNLSIKQNSSSITSYTFKKYNFNDQITLIPRIFKYSCCSYELVFLVNNNPLYSLNDIFDDDDEISFKCIATFDGNDLKMEDKPRTEKLKVLIDFIDNFSNNYVYSPYLDEFVLKSLINNKIKIENQLNKLCKKDINECIICYHKVNDNLTTCCCGKHICRICIDKIIPLKCPNCRNDIF